MRRDARRAVVLGATGHAGSAITRELLGAGVEVTAATRRSSAPPSLEGLDVTLAPGDADDAGQIDAWAEGHDLIVDAAAPYPVRRFHATSRAEADPIGYAMARTARVIAAARRHHARLAVVGSFASLPHPGDARGDLEPALLRKLHPYFAVKELVEAMVLSAARRGVPALVVSPTAFLGPWDHKDPSMCFLPLVLTGKLAMVTHRIVNVVDVRDAARTLVRATLAERFGERIAVAGHDVRVSSLVAQACELYGAPSPRLVGSTRLGAALSYAAEAALGALGESSPLPALPLLLVRYSHPMRPSAAQRALSGPPRPLSLTLRDSIRWYQSIGYL